MILSSNLKIQLELLLVKMVFANVAAHNKVTRILYAVLLFLWKGFYRECDGGP